MLKTTKQSFIRICTNCTLSSSHLLRAKSKVNRELKEKLTMMKIKPFLKLVAVLFPLSIYLIACGSNSISATSVNTTPTFGPGQTPTFGPGQTPTSGPGQTPTSGPYVTPTSTFSPDDPGVQAIPQPVPASDCIVVGNHWDCTITLQYTNFNDQRSLPWSVTANNLPGVTFTPSSDTLTPSNQPEDITAHIPPNDCHNVTDSFIFAFTTPNGRLKATTSWECPPGPPPTPIPTPTDTPIPTPTDTPIPTPTDTPTPSQ